MLTANSQAQLLWGHFDSLVGPRLTKIELVMDNYPHKLVYICKAGMNTQVPIGFYVY